MIHYPSLQYQVEELTPRQMDVLYLIVVGYSDKDIAQKLFMSPATAQNHVHNVLKRLGVSNRTEAAVLALLLELIEEEKLNDLLRDKEEEKLNDLLHDKMEDIT